jgi:glycosyltransferase involved in cell wall biosynthesis
VVTFAEFAGDHPGDPCPVVRISRAQPVPLRLTRMMGSVLAHGRGSDLIYINDHGLAPAVANLLLRRPVAMKIVGDFAWEYSVRHRLTDLGIDEFQIRRPSFRSRLIHRLQQFYVRRADRIIVPSRYLAGLVEGWGVKPSRIRVVPNAIHPDGYDFPETTGEARRALGLDFPFFLTIARLTPWKGVDRLIEALDDLPAEVRLVVVGEGPERDALEALARERGVEDRTIFTGSVAPSEVSLYLKAAEIFVLFTGYEGLSHVLLEALLVGVPIVASRKGGNPEVIRNGVDGLLVGHPDPGELHAAIRLLMTDPARRAELASAASRRSDDFSWPELFARTLEVFGEAMGRSSPGR